MGDQRRGGRRSPRRAAQLFAVGVVVLLGVVLVPQALAGTFVVTTNSDNVGVPPAGSLREAIISSNATPGQDTITFDLSFAGSTITLAGNLPGITDPVLIDGTQTGQANGAQHPRIDGGQIGANGIGLQFKSGSPAQSLVRGLSVTAFSTYGIDTGTDSVTVAGNFVGVDPSGTIGLGNEIGVHAGGPAVIGGSTPADRNVISGNTNGINLGGSGTTVLGNYIGTNAAGTNAIPNHDGIFINLGSGETVGGPNPGDANVVSGNTANGIRIDPGGGNSIFGNLIGTQADGSSLLGNGGVGVIVNQVNIANDRIGGTAAGQGNTIAFNTGSGVEIDGSGRGDPIQGNAIFSNGGLGIDLAPGGVTANDPGDSDTGPNELQNFPALAGVTSLSGSHVQVTGTVTGSLPGTFFAVDFYASTLCDPSGNGEGKRYLGSVSTQAGSFDTGTTLSGAASAGEYITATATDTFGDTSEFSNCLAVPGGSPAAGALSGVLSQAVDQNVDVSGAGPSDWAIWGYGLPTTNLPLSALTPTVTKANGGRQISDLSQVNPSGTPPRGFAFATGVPFGFNWSDGAPAAMATGAKAGITAPQLGEGFSFTAPADTNRTDPDDLDVRALRGRKTDGAPVGRQRTGLHADHARRRGPVPRRNRERAWRFHAPVRRSRRRPASDGHLAADGEQQLRRLRGHRDLRGRALRRKHDDQRERQPDKRSHRRHLRLERPAHRHPVARLRAGADRDGTRTDQRPPDQRPADQRPPDQRAPDQRPADQRPSDQRHADQRAPDQRAPDQRASDQRAADQRPPDQRARGWLEHPARNDDARERPAADDHLAAGARAAEPARGDPEPDARPARPVEQHARQGDDRRARARRDADQRARCRSLVDRDGASDVVPERVRTARPVHDRQHRQLQPVRTRAVRRADQRPPDQRPPDERPTDQRHADQRPPDQRDGAVGVADQRAPDQRAPDQRTAHRGRRLQQDRLHARAPSVPRPPPVPSSPVRRSATC